MSYVDAFWQRDQDKILVAERIAGRRVFTEYSASFIFYYDDPRGKHRTIYDTPVTKVTCRNYKEFRKELKMHSGGKTWESDINTVNRCLSENYRHQPTPKLHTAFFDIESDFDETRDHSTPEDPFSAVTAITAYLDWTQELITLALIPPTLTLEQAQALITDAEFTTTVLFEQETDMLDAFLTIIDDADVLSGWNSEGYDIPYLVNRISKIMSKDDTRRFCLWNQYPKKRIFEKYGSERETYDLIGRLHLDYMLLYQKYNYEERHSYSLNAIAEYELSEAKIPYGGTLRQLYYNDFKKFIAYNRQDVALLAKLDKKLQYLYLANAIAHDATVLIGATMGTVAVTEQSVINEAHDLGLIVPDKHSVADDTPAPGAYVADPKIGLHEFIGAVDINSLYPSLIRSLNMSPETIVGQLRPTITNLKIAEATAQGKAHTEAWENQFGSWEYQAVMRQDTGVVITIDWASGETSELSAKEVWNLFWVENVPWILSANGTIFTLEKEGVIPGLLSRWYSERKHLQKLKTLSEDLKLGIELPAEFLNLVKE